MGFKWSCPICLETHVYGGKATTVATARCDGRNLKIWQYRINETENNNREFIPFIPKNKLYFIKSGNYVKIGYTRSIKDRLNQLQSGNPNELKLIFLLDDAKDLEIPLHKFFKGKNKHQRGEWFIYDELTERVIEVLKIHKTQKNKLDEIKNRIIAGLK